MVLVRHEMRRPDADWSVFRDTFFMFVRFQTQWRCESTNRRLGLFSAWWRLSESDALAAEQRIYLEGVVDWFNTELTVPTLGPHEWRAVFWLWSGSHKFIDRMWDFAWGLKVLDVPVQMVNCQNPGRIVYVDNDQVAAVPHQGRGSQAYRLLI